MPDAPSALALESVPAARHGGEAVRFRFIDALRGLAALGITVHHIGLYGPLRETMVKFLPWGMWFTDECCWIGVQIFFVISGFVIAYSLRQAWITPSYLGNFALRRSIRLDPSYWATIGIVLLLHFLPHVVGLPSPHEEPLTTGRVLTHFGYVQNLCEYDNLSAGFWTLAVEMQFYLLFTLLLGVAQRLARGDRAHCNPGNWPLAIVFLPLAVSSLFVFNCDERYDDLILYFFGMFFLGAMAWWALDRRMSAWLFWGYVAVMAARVGWHWSLEITIALVAGVTIYIVGRLGHLGDWLAWRPLQYLGRISYSLYLIHYPVSHIVVNAGHRLTGDSPLAACGWLALSLVLSLLAAHLLHTFVEAPTARLAARFKRRESVSDNLAEMFEPGDSLKTSAAGA